jgi:peptidyl-prolyl cis-trans isomerase C
MDVPHMVPPRSPFQLILRSPLVHFAVLGGAIFFAAPRPRSDRAITLDSAYFAALEEAQSQRLGRPSLTNEERSDVRRRAIEDEILVREAIRLGIDRDDAIVRQRLIQKALFLAEDLERASAPPTASDLERFFASTKDQWTKPETVRFVHVYAAPNRRASLIPLEEKLRRADPWGDAPPELGEAFPLPRAVSATRDELARDYGPAFADRVLGSISGAWSDPIGSKFGWHLVKVLEASPAGTASFDDVKGKLPLAYLVARKKKAVADFLARAKDRYRILIDGDPIGEWAPSGRIAPARSSAVGD